MKLCIGYGKNEGKCNYAIGKNSKYWCDSCEKDRRATITKQLEDISKKLKGENVGKNPSI